MPDRSVAPEFVPPKKFKLPNPDRIEFNTGARFFFLNAGDQPIIKLEFICRAGSWFETAPGIAFFTGKMLLEGTRSFNSREIAQKLDHYGAFIDISPGFDYLSISIHIPTRHFEKVGHIILELLLDPAFPDHELDLMKQIQIQQLKINEQKNKFLASRLFRSYLYGKYPYGHIMSEEVINNITSENIINHFETYVKGKFDIFMTGNFEFTFQERILKFFGEHSVMHHPFDKKTALINDPFEHYIERKDSLQSSVYMGKRSINRDDLNYGKVLLLNEAFGGYFGSRLMQNIREEKGLTYSIYSHLVSLKNSAYFVISSDVKKEKKDLVVNEINNEIEKLKSVGIDHEELVQVKNYLKGSILNTLTTPFALTEKLKNIYYYDLNEDFYENLFDEIDQTSSNELLSLANEVLFNEPLSTVIVG